LRSPKLGFLLKSFPVQPKRRDHVISTFLLKFPLRSTESTDKLLTISVFSASFPSHANPIASWFNILPEKAAIH